MPSVVDEIARVRHAVGVLQQALASCPPAGASGEQARQLAELFCQVKRVAVAGMATFGARVAETGAYGAGGDVGAAHWLARMAGEPKSKAKDLLAAAKQAESVPALGRALRAGTVSEDQLKVVSTVASFSPRTVPDFLGAIASGESYTQLRERLALARQRRRTSDDEAKRHARTTARRQLRWWKDPAGGVRGIFSMTEESWARCLGVLNPLADELFDEAHALDPGATRQQSMVDALVEALCGSAGGERTPGGGGGGADVIVRVDARALLEGSLSDGEICEIEGVGPVPVEVARRLLGDAWLTLLVHDGVDIRTVTGRGRTVPSRLRAALLARDRHCVWPGCDAVLGLQIHHFRQDYAVGGETTLENLARLCRPHHDYCTYGGWRLDLADGCWRVTAPQHPVSVERMARERKVAAAKGRARRAGARC